MYFRQKRANVEKLFNLSEQIDVCEGQTERPIELNSF